MPIVSNGGTPIIRAANPFTRLLRFKKAHIIFDVVLANRRPYVEDDTAVFGRDDSVLDIAGDDVMVASD